MLGAQSHALRIMSKAQGFDPTRVYDPATKTYGESIENFDKDPAEDPFGHRTTGDLPRSVPDQRTIPALAAMTEPAPWNHKAQTVNDRHLDPSPQGIPAPAPDRPIPPSAVESYGWQTGYGRGGPGMRIPPVRGGER